MEHREYLLRNVNPIKIKVNREWTCEIDQQITEMDRSSLFGLSLIALQIQSPMKKNQTKNQ